MRLRIGSRKSQLACIQAKWVAAQLSSVSPDLEITFHTYTTTGDRDQTSSLTDIGGKGVFVKEIEGALHNREIDLAVHSLKDVPYQLSEGLMLGPCPKREDPREALVSNAGCLLQELPKGSIVGTSSPRRQAQIRHRFKDTFRLKPLRGNIETRLRKLDAGDFNAIIMAVAGLKRLGLESRVSHIFSKEELMPAPCQGCLGLEIRRHDVHVLELITQIKHEESDTVSLAERAFLLEMKGNCLLPLGVISTIDTQKIQMDAVILDVAGRKMVKSHAEGDIQRPQKVGQDLFTQLLANGGTDLVRPS